MEKLKNLEEQKIDRVYKEREDKSEQLRKEHEKWMKELESSVKRLNSEKQMKANKLLH